MDANCDPIFEESYIFQAARYDLVQIRVDLYYQKDPSPKLKLGQKKKVPEKKDLVFMGTHTFNFNEIMGIKTSIVKKIMTNPAPDGKM